MKRPCFQQCWTAPLFPSLATCCQHRFLSSTGPASHCEVTALTLTLPAWPPLTTAPSVGSPRSPHFCLHPQTSSGPTGGSSLLIKFLCYRELHCSSVVCQATQVTNHTDKTFFATRTLFCCCLWHTNISSRFPPCFSGPWPDPHIILVLMLIFCAGWLICKSWPPPCGQT